MAGIFPDSGVACNQTFQGACGIETVGEPDECSPLYYNQRCNVQVSPLQVNALISEIANAVNETDPYDCSKLDNLKTTLATIRNLCTQPDQPAVDFDDYLAGCFDGVSGKINVSLLADLILAEVPTLCELPAVSTAVDTDSLAGCFSGQDARIPIANLRSVLGGGAPVLVQGAMFAQTTGSPVVQNVNVGSRTRMIIQGQWTSSPDNGYAARINGFSWTWAFITDQGGSEELVYYPVQIGSQTYALGNQALPAFKVGDGWYVVNNGVATFIGSGTTLPVQGTARFFEANPLPIGG